MTTTIYILMMLTTLTGWTIMPIEGNPFSTEARCELAEKIIKERNLHYIDGVYFSRVRCVKREIKK